MVNILILTPMKDAERFLERHFQLLHALTYPHQAISLGFLVSDSIDQTFIRVQDRLPELQKEFRTAQLWQKDFGFRLPAHLPRYAFGHQIPRRAVLAKSRNYLLFRALDDEDWVLWLDVDLIEYPPDIIEQLLATGKDIITPNCVQHYHGQSFDLNAWRDRGRRHLHDLKEEGEIVSLHSVGGTMLLIKADIHREGLIFPSFLYGKKSPLIRRFNWMVKRRDVINLKSRPFQGEIETEGLGIMAQDMGYRCWGMPHLEILHRDD